MTPRADPVETDTGTKVRRNGGTLPALTSARILASRSASGKSAIERAKAVPPGAEGGRGGKSSDLREDRWTKQENQTGERRTDEGRMRIEHEFRLAQGCGLSGFNGTGQKDSLELEKENSATEKTLAPMLRRGSGPLAALRLAQLQFGKLFLARTKELASSRSNSTDQPG